MPKKFIQLVPFYPTPYELQPREDYFLMPADIMREKGYDAEFVTLQNTAPTPEYKTGKDTAPPEEIYKSHLVKRFSNILSLYRYIHSQRKNSLLQVHLRPYPPSQFASFIAPQKKALRPFTYLLGSNKLIQILTKLAMPRYDLIQCVTPYEIDIYKNAGVPEKKMKWIPLSIDYPFFSEEPKNTKDVAEKWGYADSEFVIISIAQIRFHKRFDDVMRALKVIRERIPSAKFLAVGEDWLPRQNLPDIHQLAKSIGVEDSVVITGFHPPEMVASFIHGSNAFIHGADNEYQGLVTYESAAAGKPLCLSNIGTHTSVFGENALYHEVTDHRKLAENLLRYYEDDSLRKEHAAKNSKLVQDWDYEVIKKKMSDAYDGIL